MNRYKEKSITLAWLLAISVAMNLVFLLGGAVKSKAATPYADLTAQLDAATKGWKECIDLKGRK